MYKIGFILFLMATTLLPIKTLSDTTDNQKAIRKIDFSSFTYPSTQRLKNRHHVESIKLSKGSEVYLAYVTYFDVTGDGKEEAIVRLGEDTNGTALYNYVYIYTYKDGQAKLLWKFDTGDRAEGGFRYVYGDNGNLVIELYGAKSIVYRKHTVYETNIAGDCCPAYFTRTRYKWNGKIFQIVGHPETLKNPYGHGSPIDYDRKQ